MTLRYVDCPLGCGMRSRPGPIARHARICLTPRTLERLYEVGAVNRLKEGCWLWAGGEQSWYPRVGGVKVMRIVCELAYGPPALGARPLHSCDNRACVRVDHLRWGSQAENVRDAFDRNRGIGKSKKITNGDPA